MEFVEQLSGLVDKKYITLLTVAFIGSQVLGRIYQAIVSGGGLRSICRAIWLGTNTPTVKENPKDS